MNRVKFALKTRLAARPMVDDVRGQLTRLCRQARHSPPTEGVLDQAAIRVVESTLEPPEGLTGASPPWSPPRYLPPSDQAGITKRLAFVDTVTGVSVDLLATLTLYDDGGPAALRVEPVGNGPSAIAPLVQALTDVVSLALQYGTPWEVIAGSMAGRTFPPSGPTVMDSDEEVYAQSVLDYLFRWANRKARELGGGR